MPGPLDGIRVVDLTAIVSGPLATLTLADQGADVVKVEPPGIGDLTRPMGTQRNGLSAIFAALNRNKRSVVLNLAEEEGRGLLRRLVERADVLVQNFRPGAIDRMGLGYDALRQVNPGLIYVSISGFGSTGPYARRGVYDPLIQAVSGMATVQGEGREGGGRPTLVRTIFCDKVTGLTAAQAITAALFARERGAGGQHVELSMLDAAIAFHWSDLMWRCTFLGEGVTTTPELADHFLIDDTRDGRVVVVAGPDAHFRALCEVFGEPEVADDPRNATLLDRMQRVEELQAWQSRHIARFSTGELCSRLDEAGVPCARVNPLLELFEDPQVIHNGIVTELDHPFGGRIRTASPPVGFGETPASIRRLAPGLGEHTDEVLREIGVEEADLGRLRESGVLG